MSTNEELVQRAESAAQKVATDKAEIEQLVMRMDNIQAPAIALCKENIRQAIEARGQSCPEDTPFFNYADKIRNITVSGGGSGVGYPSLKEEDVRYGVSYNNGSTTMHGTFTSDADVTSEDIIEGKIAYARGDKVIGTLGISVPTVADNDVTIPKGYIAEEKAITVGNAVQSNQIRPTTTDQTINAGSFLLGDIVIEGSTSLVAKNIRSGKSIFGVSGTYTKDATAVAADIVEGKTAYVKGAQVTGTMTAKAAETFTPGTANITIASGVYLSGTQTIKGDSNLAAANIRAGKSIFGVSGTFTSDATATANDIATGKTAYVNGSKITGVLETGGIINDTAIVPVWRVDDNKVYTAFTPLNTIQTVVRTHQHYYAAGGKLYCGLSGLEGVADTSIHWTYACTRRYPENHMCFAIGDGKLYKVWNNCKSILCLTPDLDGITQFMEGTSGDHFFLRGTDIYTTYEEANQYTKVDGISVSKILNQFIYSYSGWGSTVYVITTAGDLAEVWFNGDEDSRGFNIVSAANGDPFINYFYVPHDDVYYDIDGAAYELAFRASGLWYRTVSWSNSEWHKADNAPDLIKTNWLGHCACSVSEDFTYNEETGEDEFVYYLSDSYACLCIGTDGKLWLVRITGTLNDYNFTENGLSFEQIGSDTDWECVPPEIGSSTTSIVQKGGKLFRLKSKIVDHKLTVSLEDTIITQPTGRLVADHEGHLFFAYVGANVDLTKAGGTY